MKVKSEMELQIKRVIWRSATTRKLEEFEKKLDELKDSDNPFNIEYVDRIYQRIVSLDSMNLKLSLVNLFVISILYAVSIDPKLELSFGGFNFSNVYKVREFLLFLVSVILPVVSLNTLYLKYLQGIIEKCTIKLVGDIEANYFYKCAWLDDLGRLAFQNINTSTGVVNHQFTNIVTGILGILILVFVSIVFFAFWFMYIYAIHDVYVNPTPESNINKIVVVFSSISVICTLLIEMLKLPLPVIDMSFYEKLDKLKVSNPSEYKKKIISMGQRDEFNSTILLIFISSFSFFIFYLFKGYYFDSSLLNIGLFSAISENIVKLIVAIFISSELLRLVEKINWRYYLRLGIIPESDNYKSFIDYQKRNKRALLLIPFLVSLLIISFLV